MTAKLAGKAAIVTGASKGIGASIARHLAADDSRWMTGETLYLTGGLR